MIELRALGPLEIVRRPGDVVAVQPKAAALLVYVTVASRGSFVRRGELLALFWPEHDDERARAALRQALYALRRDLGVDVFVTRGDEEVGLNADVVWHDVAGFEAALTAGQLERAVELYHGPFLSGFFLRGSADFEQWADGERERLAGAYGNALEQSATHATEERDWRAAVEWCRRLAVHSPYSTRAALSYMEALERAGDRGKALEYATEHEARLKHDLDAAPSPDVQVYAQRLRNEPVGHARARVPDAAPADHLDRLKTALAARYAIERELGSGAMATVYLAQDLKHERQVAVKVLRPELAASLGADRFLREIKIAANLNHPHILPLHDSGEADSFLYYVMPYVDGESLRDRLNREKQLPIEDALKIASDVADALGFAHEHNVIHRDIKPENILLEAKHAVVADFGVARAIEEAEETKLTEAGIAVGTPAYLSPEQSAGEHSIDGRCDVYALGCVLYEMLAGQPPFTGPTAESIVHQHIASEPPVVTGLRPAVPESVVNAVAKSLAKAPADRYLTADELAADLGAERVTISAPTVTGRAKPPRRLVLPAVVLAIAIAVIIGAWMRGRQTSPTHPRTAIAVLPFENLSADGPYGYFAGGLHGELQTQLAKVAALKVTGRTSVLSYEGSGKRLREIGDELEVGSIVDASVQVVGNQLRVTVQIVDPATEVSLWAERYDRTLDDAFATQSEIAERIVTAVGATLTDVEASAIVTAPTDNAEAYRLYLQGEEYRRRPGYLRRNAEIAQQLYERALELDPEFALAHAALSQVHGLMYWVPYDPSPARAVRLQEEAEAAVRLAPELPEAHIAMGVFHYWGRREYRQALVQFRIALEGLPNDAELWMWIGWVHRRLGNWGEVLEAFDQATQLDPRNADLFGSLGGDTYRNMHRYPEAVRAYDRALSLAPDAHYAAVAKGQSYVLWQGQLDTLRAVLSRLPTDAVAGNFGTRTSLQVQLLHWERAADSLLQLLATAGEGVFEGQDLFLPASLYAAWAHQARGDRAAARASFDSARLLLDSVVAELPDDWRVHAARGLALAGLGRREEALREARWLYQSVVYRADAYHGALAAENRARILAQVGEINAALDEIEPLLTRPSWLSVHTLRLDPLWDPLREHPRFQALLAKYEN